MNVSLTPALEKLIRKKVKSGGYNNASEVVREALRLLEEQDQFKEAKLSALRSALQRGIDQLDKGEFGKRSIRNIAESIKGR